MPWTRALATPADVGAHWYPGIYTKTSAGWERVPRFGSTHTGIDVYTKVSDVNWAPTKWEEEYPGAVDIEIDIFVKT